MFLFRNVTFDENRELRVALKQVYGMGWKKSKLISFKSGISYPNFFANINYYNYAFIFILLKRSVISEVRIKRRLQLSISKLVDLQTYRGMRHKFGLPVHGQRTRTNANTQRSRREFFKKFIK